MNDFPTILDIYQDLRFGKYTNGLDYIFVLNTETKICSPFWKLDQGGFVDHSFIREQFRGIIDENTFFDNTSLQFGIGSESGGFLPLSIIIWMYLKAYFGNTSLSNILGRFYISSSRIQWFFTPEDIPCAVYTPLKIFLETPEEKNKIIFPFGVLQSSLLKETTYSFLRDITNLFTNFQIITMIIFLSELLKSKEDPNNISWRTLIKEDY